MTFDTFLKSFLPQSARASFTEKLRSGLSGGSAILILAWVLHSVPQPGFSLLILASMAASAVLLFAAPHSPFSQPWNLIGGHCISALAGWFSCLVIPDPVIAAGIAVGAAIFLMYVLSCLHPPGAATALTLVLGASQFQHMGWQGVALVVTANAGIMLLLALGINNLLPGRHYPTAGVTPPAKAPTRIEPEATDFEWALTEMGSVIDISLDDLARINALAREHAQSRFDAKTK